MRKMPKCTHLSKPMKDFRLNSGIAEGGRKQRVLINSAQMIPGMKEAVFIDRSFLCMQQHPLSCRAQNCQTYEF